jgi:hypothetical protein
MSVQRRYTSADLEAMPYDEWHRTLTTLLLPEFTLRLQEVWDAEPFPIWKIT